MVQYLKRQGKRIYVSAFRSSISGDLLEIIGEKNFIDIEPHLSDESRKVLDAHKEQAFLTPVSTGHAPQIKLVTKGKIEIAEKKTATKSKVEEKEQSVATPPKASLPEPPRDELILSCILNYIDETGYAEPGLVPLLRYLADETPLLANWERKDTIEKLRLMGAINVVQKDIGYDYPISVMKVAYDHELVKKLL